MEQELITHLKEKSQGTLELLHTMDNYLFIVDFEGNILLASDSLFKKAEVPKKVISNSKFYEILLKEGGVALSFYDLLLLDKEDKGVDLKLVRGEGLSPIDTFLISSSVLSNFYQDQDYILILLADMREQKKTQMQLMHSNKMVSLGEMASGIAHEINNPLTVVMGQLSVLKKYIEKMPGDISKVCSLSDKIHVNFVRITKIVKSLQTMSRNAKKAPREDIAIRVILDGVRDLSSQKLKMNNVDFLIKGDGEETVINCRETEILQVLLNLVNNSIDSIMEDKVKWVKIIIENQESEVSISVIDSGGGIPLDLQIRLFEPFYTTKGVGKGTGLGLSISKSLIEAHGGVLNYEPKSRNTCFKMTIPK